MEFLTNFWQTYIDPELSLELEPAQTNVPGSHAKRHQSTGIKVGNVSPQHCEPTKPDSGKSPKVFQVFTRPSGASTFTAISVNPTQGVVASTSSNTVNQIWINPSVKRQESFVEIPLDECEVKEWTNTNFDPKLTQTRRKVNQSSHSKYNQNTYHDPTPFKTKYVTTPGIRSRDEPVGVSKEWDTHANVCNQANEKQSIFRRPYVIEDVKVKVPTTGKFRINDYNANIRRSKYFEKVIHLKSEDQSYKEGLMKASKKLDTIPKSVPIERESIPTLLSITNEDKTVSDLLSPSDLCIHEEEMNKTPLQRPQTRRKNYLNQDYPESEIEVLDQLPKSHHGTNKNRSKTEELCNKLQYDKTMLKVSNLPPGTTHSEFQRLFPEAIVTKPLEEDDLTSYDQLCYGYVLFSAANQAKEAQLRCAGRSFRGHQLVIEFRNHE